MILGRVCVEKLTHRKYAIHQKVEARLTLKKVICAKTLQ